MKKPKIKQKKKLVKLQEVRLSIYAPGDWVLFINTKTGQLHRIQRLR